MRNIKITAACAAAIIAAGTVGCTKTTEEAPSLLSNPREVAEYKADDALRASTLRECRAQTPGEFDRKQGLLLACDRALQAEREVGQEDLDAAVRAENERALRERQQRKTP